MSTKKLSILEEFQKLKLNSTSSKVDSKTFQPNDKDQKRLIVKNISSRMVSMAIKRESTKYIFSEKIKVEEEMKRKEQEQLESKDENSTTESSPSKPDLKRGRNEKKEKKQSSSNEESMMNRIVRSHSTLSILRPSTGGFVSPNEEYANILKEGKNPQEIVSELHIQAQHQAKDSKRIFEILCSNYPSGKVVQFSPKKLTEDLDLSYLSNDNNLLANVTKLEDLAQLKAKKEGLMIIFDPSTHSHSFKATIKITYMKSIDIATEEQVSKEYIFWSDGNYFGLQFIRENYKNAITEGSSASRFNSTSSITSLMSSISIPVDEQDPEIIKISLPGWQNRPPIFIPASKCQIQIIKLDEFAKVASVANNITRLKLYVLTSSGMRNGIKKVHDFLRPSILQDIANLKVPGGLSALNFASLQGNLMVRYFKTFYFYLSNNKLLGCGTFSCSWSQY